MEMVRLDVDNVQDFEEYLTPDMTENIGRIFFRGIVLKNEEQIQGGMVWEYRNTAIEDKKESHIVFLRIKSEEAADALLDEYKDQIGRENIAVSKVNLPAKAGSLEKKILKEKGFKIFLDEGDEIVATLSEIAAIDFIHKVKPSDKVRPLVTASQRGLTTSIRRFLSMGKSGVTEDIAYLPRSYFENDISMYIEDEGIITGLFLFHRCPSGRIKIILMATLNKESVKILPSMMAAAFNAAMLIYSAETEVVINRHNYATLALGEKLFPRSFGIPVYTGSRPEN
ncbi:MAG: hypothetical protein IJU77_03325 [Butyrivibrio sp.]|nr:hypothetical protein [Butyrivibrio sp.]